MKNRSHHLLFIALLAGIFHFLHIGLVIVERALPENTAEFVAPFASFTLAGSIWLFLLKFVRPALLVARWIIDAFIKGLDWLSRLDEQVYQWARHSLGVLLRRLAAKLDGGGD